MMPPWVQTIVTVLVSVAASSGFWAFLLKKTENQSARTRLLVGLAHDRILQSGGFYIDRGWISSDEYENIYQYLYAPYKELGGNGTAERIVNQLTKLPHSPPTQAVS